MQSGLCVRLQWYQSSACCAGGQVKVSTVGVDGCCCGGARSTSMLLAAANLLWNLS